MDKTEKLTGILKRLNSGENPEQVKAEAKEFLSQVDAKDLSIAEQNLLDEGLNREDLQGLCKVHLEMLSDQVEKMKKSLPEEHIVSTLVSEHESILCFLDELEMLNKRIWQKDKYDAGDEDFKKLRHIAEHLVETELHHQREEDVLFPELEKKGVYGPQAVMEEEHKQLRPKKHELKELAEKAEKGDFENFKEQLNELVTFIVPMLRDHIFKENNILYPTALEVIEDDSVWARLKKACDEIGYCCFNPGK